MSIRVGLQILWTVLAVAACLDSATAYGAATQSSMGIATASSLQREEADKLNKQGIDLANAGDLEKAIEVFNRAFELYRQAGDREGEAQSLSNSGLMYSRTRNWSKARERYAEALPFYRTTANRMKEADLLIRIAYTFESEGNLLKAVDYFRQALPLLQAEHDTTLETSVMVAIGADLIKLGQHQRAVDLLLNVVQLCRNLKESANEVRALELIAISYFSLSNYQEAMSYYNQTLDIWPANGNRSRRAAILTLLAGVELVLSNHEQSLRHYNEALSIFRDLKDVRNQADALSLIAGFYSSFGDLRTSLSYHSEALSLWKGIDDPVGIAGSMNEVAGMLTGLSEYTQALSYFAQSLALWRKAGRLEGEARTLARMGHTYDMMGDYQKAADYLNQALDLWQKTNDPAGEADTLSKLGSVYSALVLRRIPLPSDVRIEEYVSRALRRIQDIDHERKAIILSRIGLVYSVLGNAEKGLDYYSQALRVSEGLRDQRGMADTQYAMGLTSETDNKLLKALEFYDRSIEIRDKMRASARLEEIKTGLSAPPVDAYKHAAALRMQLGEPARAFELSERARARTLLDQLANLRLRPKQKASAELRREEQTLRSQIIGLEKKLILEHSRAGSSFDRAVVTSIQSELDRTRGEYEKLLVRLKLADPDYASLRAVDTLKLPDVQALISKDTTLVSYFLTQGKTLAFILTQDSFHAFAIDATEAELKREIDWFRQFADVNGRAPECLKRLYEKLMLPLERYIKTHSVGIIPHGVLNYLPFAALTDGQQYFGERHAVYYLPSASVLRFIQRRGGPVRNSIMAVAQSRATGHPDLRYADEEVAAIANLFHTKPLATGQVSKEALLKQAGDYHVLHIAAHGELDPSNPLFSRIWLAPDENSGGALAVHEVYDMTLTQTDLIVLSACDTQLGAQSQGDDIVGLNRAFIYAGASTVIASLWTVDDRATCLLMRSFYTHLKRGNGKAEALRKAQSETRRQYPSPYYWAAFVLTGDAGSGNRPRSAGRLAGAVRHH